MVWFNTAHFALKPTFPLDGNRIRLRTKFAVLCHPVTWGTGALCLSLAVLGGSALASVPLLAAGLTGVLAYWSNNLAEVKARVVRGLIAESNTKQDKQLAKVVEQFRTRGFAHYAMALGQFLLLKQRIEREVHAGGTPTPQGEHIDSLVDQIASAACRQFYHLSRIDEKISRAITSTDTEALRTLEAEHADVLLRIQQSYLTIYESLEALLRVRDATTRASGPAPETPRCCTSDSDFERVIKDLQEETERARNVHDRLLAIADEDEQYAEFTGTHCGKAFE